MNQRNDSLVIAVVACVVILPILAVVAQSIWVTAVVSLVVFGLAMLLEVVRGTLLC